MRILFGPDHDGLHISPDTPGAYEWWYFDAFSDDGRFALVAIFFLGTPMSPYYKQVVDGKNPLPRDWCGVFFSLHELVSKRVDRQNSYGKFWRERAYAYNLYRDGAFKSDPFSVNIGTSRLFKVATSDGKQAWHLQIEEKGLWRHTLRADLHFTLEGPPLTLPEAGDANNAHTWVCTAPVCRVSGTVTLPGKEIPLDSKGYHDHNFGQLPWDDVDIWYWGRIAVDYKKTLMEGSRIYWSEAEREAPPDPGTLVFYRVEQGPQAQDTVLYFDGQGKNDPNLTFRPHTNDAEIRARFGLRHKPRFLYEVLMNGTVSNLIECGFSSMDKGEKPFAEGPFYRRTMVWSDTVDIAQYGSAGYIGDGIGEVFRPAQLCGPIASRAMWTRIRRRS